MDLLGTLGSVKDKLGAVRNLVMNYSEIEAKVRDATNNDAWGASGTVRSQAVQVRESKRERCIVHLRLSCSV
jgi:hypothetical protein